VICRRRKNSKKTKGKRGEKKVREREEKKRQKKRSTEILRSAVSLLSLQHNFAKKRWLLFSAADVCALHVVHACMRLRSKTSGVPPFYCDTRD
jgi:hypothetical protein